MTLLLEVELASADFRADPHPTYARMRREAPVVCVPSGRGRSWLVTRHSDVERVLRDEAVFSRDLRGPAPRSPLEELLAGHMLNKDARAHRRLRALLGQALGRPSSGALAARLAGVAEELVGRSRRRGAMDLVSDYAWPFSAAFVCEQLGVRPDDRARFGEWADAVVRRKAHRSTARPFDELARELVAYVREAAASRRDAPAEDALGGLLHAELDGDRLSAAELESMLVLLIVAGYETTANLVANAMVALWRNPAELERLRAGEARMATALEELVRYAGPAERALPRVTAARVELSGVEIPTGELVHPVVAAANRDPEVFERPDELDLSRSPNPHLGFGGGVHLCLGAALGRMAAGTALAALVDETPALRPATALDELTWCGRPGLRQLDRLPVVWER